MPVGSSDASRSEQQSQRSVRGRRFRKATVQHTVMLSPSRTGQHMLKKGFVDRSVREPSARNHAKRERMRKRRGV
ncbi:hypothetical protein EVA_09322 [gut metagenome]|uniref:Uncharacterized protein n=1 Tax=gut metagenome TaxID=749906 RepID=J9GKG0_9ZZZZ